MRYLLDTSVYSQPLKPKPMATVMERWKALGDTLLAVSVFCEMEILQGLRMKKSERLWMAYRAILENRLPIVEFDLKAAKIYAELQSHAVNSGQTKPIIDLMIASTALSRGMILATCNYRDFASFANLKLEDWTVSPSY